MSKKPRILVVGSFVMDVMPPRSAYLNPRKPFTVTPSTWLPAEKAQIRRSNVQD